MANKNLSFKTVFQKQIALPSDHGSWVFLLSPFLIGVFTASEWSADILILLIGLLAAFFARQPASIAIKVLSKRRSRQDLPASSFWIACYSLIGLIAFVYLARRGYGYLLWLALPGLIVFGWHLWLVSLRSERYQMGVDIIASGTLALAAPAAYWVSIGENSSTGWILWVLVWLQSASSIVYAFLRLGQRRLKESPPKSIIWQMGQRALLYSGFNLVLTLVLSITTKLPDLIWLPYLLQFIETIWGTLNPAVGVKPTKIGWRQLIVSTLFTLVFILVW
jgi:hypothetical protein